MKKAEKEERIQEVLGLIKKGIVIVPFYTALKPELKEKYISNVQEALEKDKAFITAPSYKNPIKISGWLISHVKPILK